MDEEKYKWEPYPKLAPHDFEMPLKEGKMSKKPPKYTEPIDAWRHWIEGMRERVIRTSRETESEALFLILAQVIEEQQKWIQKIEDEERVNISALFKRVEDLEQGMERLGPIIGHKNR